MKVGVRPRDAASGATRRGIAARELRRGRTLGACADSGCRCAAVNDHLITDIRHRHGQTVAVDRVRYLTCAATTDNRAPPSPTMPSPCPTATPSFQPLYLQIKALLEQSLEARRVAARRGDPERDRARARASACRRARCARRSTRSPPTTSSCGGRARARSSRRTPRSRSSLLPLPAHPPQRRRATSIPASRLLDVRRGKAARRGRAPARPQARRRRARPAPRARVRAASRWCSTRSRCPAALFRGLTKARLDAYRGSMYGFFETQFGVRMLKAQEKLRAVAADAASARRPRRRGGRAAARRRSRDARPTATVRSKCGAACARRSAHHYLNELG